MVRSAIDLARRLALVGTAAAGLTAVGASPALAASPQISVLKADASGQPLGQTELTSATPGTPFALEGGDFPASCAAVKVAFDTVALGSIPMDPGGSFQHGGYRVPSDSKPGDHQVTAVCTNVPASAAFAVHIQGAGSGAAGGAGGASDTSRTTNPPGVLTPSRITQALRSPAQVPLAPADLLRSALLAALLMVLIAFPSELFNSTLQEHYDEVKGWFGFGRGSGERFAGLKALLRNRALALPFVVVVSAALYGLLDPAFGLDLSSLATFLGIAGAVILATFAYALTSGYFIRLRHGHRGALQVFPAALIIAAVCVLISRVTNFLPGYMYGLLAAFQLVGGAELHKKHSGRAQAVAAVVVLGLSALAWIAWIPVKAAAGADNPSFVIVLLSCLLAGTFIAGIEGVMFGLLPLRFMDGEKVMAWNRVGWIALFGIAAFLFVHVLLNPAVGYVSGQRNIATALVLFGAFGLGSVAFWAYFRFRTERVATVPEDSAAV